MSVEYSTTIGLGWLISNDEYEIMQEGAGYAWNDIVDDFIPVDAWAERTDYFLGATYGNIEPGMALNLINVASDIQANLDTEWFNDKFGTILTLCGYQITPDSKWANANLYILSLVH